MPAPPGDPPIPKCGPEFLMDCPRGHCVARPIARWKILTYAHGFTSDEKSEVSAMRTLGISIAALLLTLSGCGSSDSSTTKSDAKAQAQAKLEERAAEDRAKAAEAAKAKQTAVHKECVDVTEKLATKLSDLDSRLSVGLPFADYGKRVGDARVAYDQLLKSAKQRGGISDKCINGVGTPLESAMNQYIDAYNVWNECVQDYDCTFEGDTLKKAQTSWSKATRLIEKASNKVDGLAPSP